MDRRKKLAYRIPKSGLSSSGILKNYRYITYLTIVLFVVVVVDSSRCSKKNGISTT
jgi:hypothetical protein